MTASGSDLATFAIGMISLFSPASNIGPFALACGRFPSSTRLAIAARVAGSYILIALAAVWLGRWLFAALGVTVASLTATGGLCLVTSGLPMALRGSGPRERGETSRDVGGGEPWTSLVLVPLTFPLSIGGATAAYIVAQASRFNSPTDRLAISAVCLGCALVVGVTVYLAGAADRWLSPPARDVVTRLSGIVIVCLAFQLLVGGVTELALDAGFRAAFRPGPG